MTVENNYFALATNFKTKLESTNNTVFHIIILVQITTIL